MILAWAGVIYEVKVNNEIKYKYRYFRGLTGAAKFGPVLDDLKKFKVVGIIHTHITSEVFSDKKSNPWPNQISDEKFMDLSNMNEVDFYLVTPEGFLYVNRGGDAPMFSGENPRDKVGVQRELSRGHKTKKNKNNILPKLNDKNWRDNKDKPIIGKPSWMKKYIKQVN
ncbi:hypothetical protein [Polluticaenibacter yanchengensis]|uniref:JAB domain-containing protein n=1 Tax=Polluticaenibacter yanchengensis TaxID=3014562 RepID=A0ABT4URI6_9BACT|nr:hypothetical protein [Chitinophagaceae bacterium LY-5]